MGLFSRSPELSRKDLRQLLYDVSILESDDRDVLEDVFSQYVSGGVSKYEIRRAIKKIISDKEDGVSRSKAKVVKRKLLRALKGKE